MVHSIASPPLHRDRENSLTPNNAQAENILSHSNPHVRGQSFTDSPPTFFPHSPPGFLRQRGHGDATADDRPAPGDSNALSIHSNVQDQLLDRESKGQSPLLLSSAADRCPDTSLIEIADTPEMKRQARKVSKARTGLWQFIIPDIGAWVAKRMVDGKVPSMRFRTSAFIFLAGLLMVVASFKSIPSLNKVSIWADHYARQIVEPQNRQDEGGGD